MVYYANGRPEQALSLFDKALVGPAIVDSFRKLDPRDQARNPVMFVVFVGSLLTTGLWIDALRGHGETPAWFIGAVALWLWFTVLFANFAEAMAEGRGKAQAETLRRAKTETMAKRERPGGALEMVPAPSPRRGCGLSSPRPGSGGRSSWSGRCEGRHGQALWRASRQAGSRRHRPSLRCR